MNNLKIQFEKIEHLTAIYKSLEIDKLIDHDKLYLYSIIANSTRIEGSSLSEIDIQLLFDEGLTYRGKPLLFHLMNNDLKSGYD